MSDVKNIWVLKQPVSIEDYDGGDLVEVDGHILLQSEIKELFVPLDVESLTTQLDTKFENAIDCGYLLGKAESANVKTLDELVEIQKIRIQQLTAEVLELIGITKDNKDD